MKLICLFDSVYSPFIIFFVGLIFSETLENISKREIKGDKWTSQFHFKIYIL